MSSLIEEVKKELECFAYKEGKCKILKVNQCEGTVCSFFKTVPQLSVERQRSFEHIQSLDDATRDHIMDFYNIDSVKQQKEVASCDS
ncbi:hypothetical protein E1I69_05835 [Bacillus timonensis]|uniref:Uncharacterized protein n=1 Tax=Bacillus timonensis TaxID=1033734 RepID=A0A4S3PWA7_9BACI|nr:hypothetical protein [Bacillus timonensis]THE14018.1 hypothetical protein E1I69_05835 [Bacillus timonensis]